MSPVAVGAVVLGVVAAVSLFRYWLRGGFNDWVADDLYPRREQTGLGWPEPPWDAQSIRTTLAEIETL